MKLIILLVAFLLCVYAYPSEEKDVSSVEDSSHAESESDSKISKRSGSFDIISQVKSGLLSGVSKASASSSSGSSGSSSAYKEIDHHHVVHGNSIEFDPWTLKKSVLNTLFQAVKAITGGVAAIKGQLIKGSGYASSASGKIVAVGGEKISDIGKTIIHSAALIPPSYGHASIHPFKLSHGSSSGGAHVVVPVVHTDAVQTYEVAPGYLPVKAPHGYLPAATYGQPFIGHAAYEDSANIDFISAKYGLPNDDFIDYGISPRKPTDLEAAKAAEALKQILGMSPTKSKPQSNNLPRTEAVTEKYIVRQLPIPSHINSIHLSPLDLYKKMKVKDNTISYEHNDYKYPNYHQQNPQNSNLNNIIAATVAVDENKKQNSQYKLKPYFYNPPELKRRKYSGNQIRDVSSFNNQLRT